MDSGGFFFLMRHTPNEVISGEKALITFLSNLNRSLLRLVVGRHMKSQNVSRQLYLSWQRILRLATWLLSRDLQITATQTHSLRGAGVSTRP